MAPLFRVGLVAPFAVFLGLYAPSVGHGFIADDFGWILHSRVADVHDLVGVFQQSRGFYRPVVAVSFAADYALFGTHPFGYGLTNLVLAIVCGALVYLVAHELSLPRGAAIVAAALWLLNPHGINTAILWMSGRTELLLTLGSLAAALLMLRGHPFLALLPAAIALFAKEEAVVLPAILACWWIVARPRAIDRRTLVLWAIAAAALLGVYFALRSRTGAMTPATAPAYYRLTTDPALIARNVLEYADRAMTFSAAFALLAILVLRPTTRIRDSWVSRDVVLCGAAWIAGGYAITVLVPVRSSLYACFPSVGACLIAADIAARRWESAATRPRQIGAVAAVVVSLALIPVYVLRNRATVANARFSSAVLDDLAAATGGLPDGASVIVLDDRSHRPNVDSAFNGAINDAFALTSGRRLDFRVEPPPLHSPSAPPCAGCARLTVHVRDGHVVH